MKRLLLLSALLLFQAASAMATFSIVAIDPETGDLGVAVASRYFSVGTVVPWAEAAVGAIATQADVNVGYGSRGLELLKQGLTAHEVLERLLAEDKFGSTEGRQIAIIDANGNVAVKSGGDDWSGHKLGATWSAQGNILVGPEVVEAMGTAFETAHDDLAERLYAALKAGDDAGGDSRGRQSASILVVRKGGGRNTNNDRLVYINVDDHPDPLAELRRLLNIAQNENYSRWLRAAVRAGKVDEALDAAEKLVRLDPLDPDRHMTLGFVAYLADKSGRALAAFARAKELTLPNEFKNRWNAQSGNPRYKRVLDDKAFVARVIGTD